MKEIIIIYLQDRNGQVIEVKIPDNPGRKVFLQKRGRKRYWRGMQILRAYKATLYEEEAK